MLKRLCLENFALIDKLEIEFVDGLSVITGETGAGKSIIVGALARLMGDKADRDDIRSGYNMAAIECDFDTSDGGNESLCEVFKELDNLNIESKHGLINIRREIFKDRASKSFINGQYLSLTQLRKITQHLAELYGQHSHQKLLDERNHLGFLDNFAGIADQVEQLRQTYAVWDRTGKELDRLEAHREMEIKEQELLRFQKDDIEKGKIQPGEEENLLAERKILDASQILAEKSSLILDILDRQEQSALQMLGTCRKILSEMSAHDIRLGKKEELLGQSIINLSELRTELESYQSSIPDDPGRLDEINLRLDEIYRLKKKYGGSEESILAALEEIKRRLDVKIDVDERIRILGKEKKEIFEKYLEQAAKISSKRRLAAGTLSDMVENELGQLGIAAAKFQFEFQYENDENGIKWEDRLIRPTPEGFEGGRFLISANPGEPLKPLARIASGGEISRIMLALKAADRLSANVQGSLVVFDEIDVGIGGRTAGAVAQKLKILSRKHQLLVVTHLHQIASVTDQHFAVEKIVDKSSGRNLISVKKLNKAERTGEIKRMLALPAGTKS